jgi:dynein light intermediate chain 2
MSRSKAADAEDIWSKLQKNPLTASADVADSNGSSLVFVGDLSAGKSTLIQTFLKPSAAKDTKPTIALEYNFARKTTNNSKSVANLWEIGGDLVEPKLMEIGITMRNLPVAVVVIVLDLSKPHNLISSLLRTIGAVREITKKRAAELQATNVNLLNEVRDKLAAPYKGHPDEARVRPLDITLCIVANKHDLFKSLPSADRRNVMQTLRFVAHFFGAHLITASSSEAGQREAYRGLITSLAFGAPVKPAYEVNADKLVYVTKGADNFQKIFLEHTAGEGDSLRGKVSIFLHAEC